MDIKERLEKIFKKVSKKTDIDSQSSLKDLGLDSLDVVEVLMEIEEEFNIKFEDEEMTSLKIVQDLYDAIERKLK